MLLVTRAEGGAHRGLGFGGRLPVAHGHLPLSVSDGSAAHLTYKDFDARAGLTAQRSMYAHHRRFDRGSLYLFEANNATVCPAGVSEQRSDERLCRWMPAE
ncbi:hypothetical protein GCM10009835_21960 [Planosporangium flavigriseum]|uniref:Uncharacterized protein n=1 Tax=Planosporangium flavigriseum TaxID=373681 RepID=A0A8J3PM16_9ACTN|nr:hypothetical protein Pfl04_22380 [Planosporangium flavigriseum]